MKLYIIHSGSDGNCCILTDSQGNQLMLDCGLKKEKIITYVNFMRLNAILVTHSHVDHSLSVKEFAKYQINTYTQDNVKDGESINVGNWIIVPMKLIHNVPCFGYLVYNRIEKKKIAYITDTTYLPQMNEVDCFVCDCNYDLDILGDLQSKGVDVGTGYQNHLAIQVVKEYLRESPHKFSCFVAYHLSNRGLINIDKLEKELSPFVERFVLARPNTEVQF